MSLVHNFSLLLFSLDVEEHLALLQFKVKLYYIRSLGSLEPNKAHYNLQLYTKSSLLDEQTSWPHRASRVLDTLASSVEL